MQKITPFLWFDSQAEEAAKFYVSVFGNSRILKIVRYGKAGPGPAGSVMTVAFELNGVPFTALNGGPQHPFSEAISFVVNCQSQAEVDTLWEKLSAGGRPDRCGWVKDRFGLSWQIVPSVLPAESFSHSASTSAWLWQLTTNEIASENWCSGPPLSAVNWTPFSSNTTVMTEPSGPGPALP